MAKSKRKLDKPSTAILTLRSAFILVCAVLTGTTAGALTYSGTRDIAMAALAATTAFGSSLLWFDKIVADDSEQ